MPKINSLEVVHQDTNQDSYQNLHDILVALNKSLALEKEVVDGEARASIENLLEIYANDKKAFLKSIQTLTTKFLNSQAIYSEEIMLLASQLEAQARRTTTITAQTENNIATVKEYSEAIASDVERKVSTYSQDTPPTEASDGSALTYGDLWYDTNDNNKLYRWNDVAWIATDDSRIATTYARWGVQVDANGNVAGIQLNSDNTGTSEFTVVANNFRVFGTGALDKPVFTTRAVNGTNTIVLNGATMLGDNAVTIPTTVSSTTIQYGGGTSVYRTLLTITVTNDYAIPMPVIGIFSGRFGYDAGAKLSHLYVNKDGSTLIDYEWTSAINDFQTFQFSDTIAASSSATYVVGWQGEDSTVYAYKRYVTVLGVKR